MKHLFTLTLLVIFSFGFAQDFKPEWKEIIQFELDGKIKSAHEAVNLLYKKAKRKKANDQIIKCFFYQSKFIKLTDENGQNSILDNLNKEIKDSKGVQKALLNYVRASILQSYYQHNSYAIRVRTKVSLNDSKDWKTWTYEDFESEINNIYKNLLKDEKQLRAINIKEYAEILQISPYTDTKKMSIYDFLLSKTLMHHFSKLYITESGKNEKISNELYKSSAEFITFKTENIDNTTLKTIIELYQENERYCLKNGNDDIHLLQYNRMSSFKTYFSNLEYYFAKLDELEKATANNYLKQQLKVDKANYYFSLTVKGGGKNYHPQALSIIENVLEAAENPNAKAEAESLKEKILGKKINLNIPSKLYSNQNYKAFVEYKNIDTVKVSYYKIPFDIVRRLNFNSSMYYRDGKYPKVIDRDSLVARYIEKHKPIKSSEKVLPSKSDYFEYSTEILMDNLDLGAYLIYFEVKNPYGSPSNQPYAYHIIQVSNLDYATEVIDDHDAFQVLNRKTGQPVEKASVQNDESTIQSDKIGLVRFPMISGPSQGRFSDLILVKEKDSLYSNYYRSVKYNYDDSDEDEYFEAKSMVLFDRAIYRPGQKVYFKGFMLKSSDKVKSVVPFLTVRVIITDANEDEVKEFDIQTNEFGSFTGEYEIPKNVLTGKFKIEIEEPDDYEVDTKYYNEEEDEHNFWDKVRYHQQEYGFRVEEYKRPTFEIKLDQIKENYTIGDTIIVSGNAKTLAGSNLTNAKVSYEVTKHVYERDSSYDDEEEISGEVTTDENGNFKMELNTDSESLEPEEIEKMNFDIKVAVTDINGETRTANSTVRVGREMLKLDLSIDSSISHENPKSAKILATTLNDFAIPVKGSIRLLEKKTKQFLKAKQFVPELQTLSRTEHERLFPYQAYNQQDMEIVENEVLNATFDTEKTTTLDLALLKKFKPGDYKIVLEAKDQNGNLIKSEKEFQLVSKIRSASNKTLFTFNKLENDPKNFVFELRSLIPDLYFTTRMYNERQKKSETVIQLKNGTALVKLPKESKYDDEVVFHFSTIWENQYYEDDFTISKEEIQSKLQFEIRSIRNKIEPGSIENWTFAIKNPTMQAEVLASMYDSSLDQFATEDWNVPIIRRHYNFRPRISHQNNNWYENNIRFDNLHFTSKYYQIPFKEPQIEWFGFDFNTKSNYLNVQYLKKFGPEASVPKNAKTVYGIVSDKTGPIPGANVYVRGTDRKTQTDFDGYYEIDVEKGETISISFTGYTNSEIRIDKNRNINVSLNEQAVHLEEVVVMGYDKVVSKSMSVSSIISTSAASSKADILEALQGNVAGLNISASSGSPGSSKFVLLRGAASNVGNQPLFVVDGVPMTQEQFLKMNPDDIKNIMVLKDTAATSLYGSRAAGGVIVITTRNEIKELEQVKTRTNFNETAFFYPNLTTDEKGEISFNFTTPESLTKWKLRLFAHNKKAQTGYLQTDIVSQKDIMVMPNMPRFVREKDTINFAVKVTNLTFETKSGNAILLLYDAATNNPVDAITMNSNNTKPFNCKAKESVVVNWTITLPEGIQGLRYKVIAKSGNLSDGEENILPVLTDRILITESIPIWVKGNTKREFTFTNLTNPTATMKHHALTFEYTSNPVWMALQSLPYLMNYPHECAEQTFAKYYANCIAEKILTGNPKVASLMEKWKTTKIPESRLKMNEELKSVVLAETPWLLDSESDELKNQKLAILMDLSTLKENNEKALSKVETLILPSGGFSWFPGGSENTYISQHILSGIGHLNKLFPADSLKYKSIISKGIPNADRLFTQKYSKTKKDFRLSTVDLNYLYMRSFFTKEYPFPKKCDSLVKIQLANCKENWLGYSLYQKGLLALVLNRSNEKAFAKKIIESLKQTVSNNEEIGMYWLENTNGYYWYESAIETQALLIEAFAEIDNDKQMIDAMKVWLIKNKQVNSWPTTKATTEAVYALLYQGSDWTSIKENTKIKIGDEKILTKKLLRKDDEMDSGYLKIKFDGNEIDSKMSTISVDNKTKVPGFGGVFWQYFETLENVKSDSTKTLSVDKKIFKKVKNELVALDNETLKVGDLITIRMILRTNTDLEFVHLKDLRASCLEPVDVLSGRMSQGGIDFYRSIKDVSTNFFFDNISKGTYVLEYDLRVTNKGTFNNGIATLQSMYSPEYTTHSLNTRIKVNQ